MPESPAPHITNLVLHCPKCGTLHLDVGEWHDRPHKTHLCLNEKCGHMWRPVEDAHTRGIAPCDSLTCVPGDVNAIGVAAGTPVSLGEVWVGTTRVDPTVEPVWLTPVQRTLLYCAYMAFLCKQGRGADPRPFEKEILEKLSCATKRWEAEVV